MEYSPGKIVWWELNTRTPAAFYTELVGWKKVEWPMPGGGGTYTMFGMNPETAAVVGMAEMQPMVPKEVPAHWAPYVSVDDVDATAKAFTENGGKVLAGPFDIPDQLRMAVCQDAAGGICNIMRSFKGDGPDLPSTHGCWHWAEYYSPNIDATLKFYSAVFGWTAEEMPVPNGKYYIFKKNGVQRAGAMPRPAEHIPPMWLAYLHVDDVDATWKNATGGGAHQILAPMTAPGIGRFAQFVDPNGAVIGLIKPDRTRT